jgi:hypothetical protein
MIEWIRKILNPYLYSGSMWDTPKAIELEIERATEEPKEVHNREKVD